MSRYDIRLRIAYHYPSEVKDARHILRVSPRESRGQTLEKLRLDISPGPAEMASETDFFGNGSDHFLLSQPHENLTVEMQARVAVARPHPDLRATPTVGEIGAAAFASRGVEGDDPLHFLGAGRLVEPSERIAVFVRETMPPDATLGTAAMALTQRIRKEFRFQSGVTSISTGVEETFQTRRGVCQDFSHMMIAGLRGCGIPARYASGFLRTEPPPGKPRLEGADAMHAWVEIWAGQTLGWIGFDPTNGCLVGNDHVLVALGRDYADVAPIDGVLMTSGPQRHHHSVDMVPIPDV